MLHPIKNESDTSAAGYTLVELAIAIAIFGLVLAIGLLAIGNYVRIGKERTTLSNFENIADSISIFAQANYRIPCPSTANEANVNFGLEVTNANGDCSGLEEGILPFRTLGLHPDFARDGFKQFMTYRVSPAATLNVFANTAFWDTVPIGQWCMTEPNWYQDTNDDGVTDSYVNIQKAALCCGSNYNAPPTNTTAATDVLIFGANEGNPDLAANSVNALAPQRQVPGFGGTGAEYTFRTAARPNQGVLAGSNPSTYVGYVLVSHGENTFGSFSTNGARTAAAAGSAEEQENSDGDNIFYASDRVSAEFTVVPLPANLQRQNFDDIVYWQSPSQIMSRFGEVSCNRP